MDIVNDRWMGTAAVLFVILMRVLIMKPWSVLVFFVMPRCMPFICCLFIRDLNQISVSVWMTDFVMRLLTIHDMSFQSAVQKLCDYNISVSSRYYWSITF